MAQQSTYSGTDKSSLDGLTLLNKGFFLLLYIYILNISDRKSKFSRNARIHLECPNQSDILTGTEQGVVCAGFVPKAKKIRCGF
jgi:hypothetical protein